MVNFIFYGSRASNLGSFEVQGTVCQHCQEETNQAMTVFGKYGHLYWIPFFPLGKAAVSECTSCYKTIEANEFTPQLRQAYAKIREEVSSPKWHWTGVAIIAVIALMIGIAGALHEEDPRDFYLKQDALALSKNPSETHPSDTTAGMLATMFKTIVNEEMYPDDFSYATSTVGGKTLILMKVPNLDELEPSEWDEIPNMINELLDLEEGIKNNKRYIAIFDNSELKIIRTPNGKRQSHLYSFYGDRPPAN